MMLQHEQLDANQDVSASQRRVTPQELTRALASIEAQKEEAARRQEEEERCLAGTITLGQAVKDLSLTSTPEEIWAEVKTQQAQDTWRSGKPQSANVPELAAVKEFPRSVNGWKQRRRNYLLGMGTIASILLATAFATHHGTSQLKPFSTYINFRMPPSDSHAAYNMLNYPSAIPYVVTGEQMDRVMHGERAATVSVDPQAGFFGGWNVVNYSGRPYLRGWVATRFTDRMPPASFDIFNVPNTPEQGFPPVQITVPIDTCHSWGLYGRSSMSGGGEIMRNPGEEKFCVSDVHLDSHAWEQWTNISASASPPAIVASGTKIRVLRPNLQMKPLEAVKYFLHGRSDPIPANVIFTKGRPLTQLSDATPFALNIFGIDLLLSGLPPSKLRVGDVQTNLPSQFGMGSWQLVKYSGQLYLRGWVSSNTSETSSRSQFVHLFNFPDAPELGNTAKPITLRIGSFNYRPYHRIYTKQWYLNREAGSTTEFGGRFLEQIVISGLHLDKHAWEKW